MAKEKGEKDFTTVDLKECEFIFILMQLKYFCRKTQFVFVDTKSHDSGYRNWREQFCKTGEYFFFLIPIIVKPNP